MENKVNYSVVGAFVLVLGAALIAGVLWLAAGVNTQKKALPYQSIMKESVAGLSLDAPVKYLGVDVGKVTGIAIDPQNSRQVRLLFMIESGTPIKQDSEAVLKTQGLTGIAYVELSGGTASSPALVAAADGAIPSIRSTPSLSARLENVFTNVLSNVDRTAANLNAVLDADNRDALKQVLADTAAVTRALALQQHALSAGIANAALTASNAARASAQLGPAIEQISVSAQAVAGMADVAKEASAGAGRTVAAAELGVRQLSNETLPEMDRLLAELNQLAPAMRRFSEQTTANPTSLLVGGPVRPAGPGERARP